jgi:hypothetical protein
MSLTPLISLSPDRSAQQKPDLYHQTERELTLAVSALLNEFTNFGLRFIQDSRARSRYNSTARAASRELLNEVLAKRITLHEATQRAHTLRNTFMEFTINITSDVGNAVASTLKKEGRAFDALLKYYSNSLFLRTRCSRLCTTWSIYWWRTWIIRNGFSFSLEG